MRQDKFLPTRFVSLRAKTPSPITWENVVEELRGDQHLKVTQCYRETLLALQEAERSNDESAIQRLKAQKILLKQNQPAIIASVTLEGGRATENITGYTGFILVDIDGIPDERFDYVLLKVREDPYGFLVHTTLSGRGIRVFARVEGPLDKRLFPIAWRAVNDHYANLTGIAIDDQTPPLSQVPGSCPSDPPQDPERPSPPSGPPRPSVCWLSGMAPSMRPIATTITSVVAFTG